MIRSVYYVYDVVAKQVASTLILSDNDDVLVRDFKDSKLPDVMEHHPEDFDLMKIGVLDTETGILQSLKPELVVHLGAIKHGKE